MHLQYSRCFPFLLVLGTILRLFRIIVGGSKQSGRQVSLLLPTGPVRARPSSLDSTIFVGLLDRPLYAYL